MIRVPVGVGIALALVLIGVCIGYVDRPWAELAHAALRQPVFVHLTFIADPVLPVGVGLLVLMGIAVLFGWRPGRFGRILLALGLAAVIAFAVKEELKYVFGRTWPETWVASNPSWITDHVFAFLPFHGGRGWSSFPSGHTAMISAPMTVLARTWPRWRWLAALPVLLVAVGLLGADYHWPSDVIAGALVGWCAGLGAMALARA